jgi:hypothetical protein
MNIRLWFIMDSDSGEARLFSKLPSSRNPGVEDRVWIPRSQIERCQKQPVKPGEKWPEHHMTITDWIAEKKGL